MAYRLDIEQLDRVQDVLAKELVEAGAHLVILLDLAGNVITTLDDGECDYDVYSLAALAAGNFGAVNQMAALLREDGFSVLFHKGDKEHMHFSKVKDDFLLVNVFGNQTSLGYLRLKVAEVTAKLENILGRDEKS
ncbi:MAG: roadblock/LC7 domain-containing protein [Thermodesulfobacteriota bacterium]